MRPQCLKCKSTRVSIERRLNGNLRCLDCGEVWTRVEEDQAIIRDLREQLDTKGVFCGYCKVSLPEGSTWEQLQAHTRTCAQHPLAVALEALRFYADPVNYVEQETGIGMFPSAVDKDGGSRAQEAVRKASSD
jgi:hypothetical protein